MNNVEFSDEKLKQLILSNCSKEFQNSAFIVAKVLYDLNIIDIIIGDMYIEGIMREMIADGDLSSDGRGAYGFYSVSR